MRIGCVIDAKSCKRCCILLPSARFMLIAFSGFGALSLLFAVGLGHAANFEHAPMSVTAPPGPLPFLTRNLSGLPFDGFATGEGQLVSAKEKSIAFVRGTDATSWEYGKPDGVVFSFQVSL